MKNFEAMSANTLPLNYDIKFENLKLIDRPDNARNAKDLPQTLVGCEGYLNKWSLQPPNVDPKIPSTIADMVNVLTDPSAVTKLEIARLERQRQAVDVDEYEDYNREEGQPDPVYIASTSTAMKTLLQQTKKRVGHRKGFGVIGHIVAPGCMSFYKLDGKTFAVTEGRWILTNMKAAWIKENVPIDQNQVTLPNSRVLIIRVQPGCVGCIFDQGTEVLLDVGTHVFNSGTVVNAGTVTLAEREHVKHGRYNYVRVPRGKIARVWVEVCGKNDTKVKSMQPRLLAEGEHYISSHLFQYKGMSNISDEYIQHGSIHRISVNKGFVAKVMHDNLPRLLGEGDHIIESTQFTFEGLVNIQQTDCISHHTINIVRVVKGQVALCWLDNEPTLIEKPGLYDFDSPEFLFVEFKDAEEQYIQLGSKKIILCHTGEVAVTFDDGQLKVLKDGRHIIDSSTHVFQRFLSVQQRSIRLSTLSAEAKRMRQARSKLKRISDSNSDTGPSRTDVDYFISKNEDIAKLMTGPDSDLAICETKDLVKVGLRADVFYSIEDPEKCIKKINTDELEDLVRETAIATLTNIIRSTALNEIAQSKRISAGDIAREKLQGLTPAGPDAPPPTAPTAVFFEKVHDEFLSLLNEDFMERYGVDIANIRIESFKIMDEELSEQISKHALTTAQIENEMANLEGTSLITTTRERTAAEKLRIATEADAAAKKTTADASNQREIEEAKARAESHKIDADARAQAAADAILIKAKAEAEALRLRALAEAQKEELDAARTKAEALTIMEQAKSKAEAEAIIEKAKAEAEAIRLKAVAEAERAEMLSQTELGRQQALLEKYAEMVIASNQGVEKVIYLDPSVNRDSPFALGSLQNLNMDLHSLTRLGIAAASTTNGNKKQKESLV